MALSTIAIIPDGNRRFAQKHSLPLAKAYLKGFEKVDEVVEWAGEFKLRELTFWALSLENFRKRSRLELEILFRLMSKNVSSALSSRKLSDSGASVSFFGRTELLPAALQQQARELEEETAGRGGLKLNIAIAYSGQDELVNASRRVAEDVASGVILPRQVDAALFSKYLFYSQSPDLIIRTGDVQRLSGFMPFQSAYSEFYFSPKLWPEFSREDFAAAVDYYDGTQRRFGK
ncbi:MAG: polyprenyl diphosphate synthase [Candidatus Micrarchaeota archaeon]